MGPLWLRNALSPIFRLVRMIELWEGAQTSLYAALSPDVPEYNGAYFSQNGVYRDKSLGRGGWPLRSPNPNAHDDEKARQLWEISEELAGLGAQARAAG